MYSKRELVVVVNGSVVGTTYSSLHNLIHLAKDFNQKEIHVFINTWDDEENNKWVATLQAIVDSFNMSRKIVHLHIEKEKYNSAEAYNFFYEFQRQLGLTESKVNHTVSKKLFYFYTLVKALKQVENYNPNASIYRMVSNYKVDVEVSGFHFEQNTLRNILLHHYHNRIPTLAEPKDQGLDFEDILFSSYIDNNRVEEVLWVTSFKVAKNIYSTSTQEILRRLSKLMKDYKNHHPDIPSTITGRQLQDMLSDRFFVPIEGGNFIKHLIDEYAEDTYLCNIPEVLMYYHRLEGFRNAWLDIYKSKIEVVLPMEIKYNMEYIINHYDTMVKKIL